MTIKEQLQAVKKNWLIAVLVLLIVIGPSLSNLTGLSSSKSMSYPMMESASYRDSGITADYSEGFAPEITDRKITKNSNLNLEIARGEVNDKQKKVKAITQASNSLILSENQHSYGEGKTSYKTLSYNIKVDKSKYSLVLDQLKELGEITSYNENALDITESYTNIEIELNVEKERLKRYQEMYIQAVKVEDQINLNDRIFDQERRIKYLEDRLENKDQQVEYSNIHLTLTEERSTFLNVAFVTFGDLVSSLIDSINSILYILFVALPYLIVGSLIWVVIRFRKKR